MVLVEKDHGLKVKFFTSDHWKYLKKALGRDHPYVATVLGNMAKCYREMGIKDEAENL